MKFSCLSFALTASLLGCGPRVKSNPLPNGRFYYPTGVAFIPSQDEKKPDGFLYVANSNFDRRYDSGALSVVDLSVIGPLTLRSATGPGLSQLVGNDATAPLIPIELLNPGNQSVAQIADFASEIDFFPQGTSSRLFIPTRAEGDYLQIVDASQDVLSCVSDPSVDNLSRDCTVGALSLSSATRTPQPKPRAPLPYGVSIARAGPFLGTVAVTHLQDADDPVGSLSNPEAYLFTTQAVNPYSQTHFVSLGTHPPNSVVAGGSWAYASGTYDLNNGYSILRMISLDPNNPTVVDSTLEKAFNVSDTRGIAKMDPQFEITHPKAPSSYDQRLFMLSRGPDALLVVKVDRSSTPPATQIVREIPLPSGPTEARILRVPDLPGQDPSQNPSHDLVFIVCGDASELVVYDESVGALVAQLGGIGNQPYDLAIDARLSSSSSSARIFITAFNEGQVNVVSVPNLYQPQFLQRVARLGKNQFCLANPRDISCKGVVP